MTKPKLLDLFCKAGGTSMGYYRAGFDVTGVDVESQIHYPFRFVQADAFEYFETHWQEYDFLAGSPPCHHYSSHTQHRKNKGVVYPDLLPGTQERFRSTGKPYIIENVPGAVRLMLNPIMLCGGMFGLGVVRHRFFESNLPLIAPEHICNTNQVDRDLVSVTRHGPPARWYKKHPGAVFSVKIWHEAMGIDWMNRTELTQAIPPAYTEYLGKHALVCLEV